MMFDRQVSHKGCCSMLWFLFFLSGLVMAQTEAPVEMVTPSLEKIEALYGKVGSGDFVALWPVAGASRISSPFGMRMHPIKGTKAFHQGLDIAAPEGTAILSVAPGKVQFAGWKGGYGRIVEIRHDNGWISRYAHAKILSVQAGDWVKAGQIIGQVGCSGNATGAHLHLEIEYLGRKLDPEAFWATYAKLSPR